MRRALALLALLFAIAGCGDPGGAHEVPVSKPAADPGRARPTGANAVTRPARAIATH